MVHYLLPLVLVLVLVFPAEAQRDKRSCYEKYEEVISCNFTDSDVNPETLLDVDDDVIDYSQAQDVLWLEETCRRIEEEVFLNEFITEWDQQVEYLNGYASSEPLCTDIPVAFHHCRFCNSTMFLDCQYQFIDDSVCTNDMSAEQILKDNTTTYAQFQTQQDIDNACFELSQVPEHNESAPGYPGPRTMELCEKQHLVKHLCDGCNNALCFDPFRHPTECVPKLLDNETAIQHYGNNCSLMLDILSGLIPDKEELLDTSNHLTPLAVMDGDHPWCPAFRQAYPYCPWCSGEFCFDDSKLPSCKKPTDINDEDMDDDMAEKVCRYLFHKLQLGTQNVNDVWNLQELYNSTAHASLILIPDNTERCDLSRKYYHKCSWCDERAKNLSCGVVDPCAINITTDPDFVPESLLALNESSGYNLTGPVEDHCDYILEKLKLTNRTDSGRAGSLKTCLEDFYFSTVCPQRYCPNRNMTGPLVNDQTYLGASNDAQAKALIWTSRVSAFLSFFGACYILYDTLSDKKARKTTYYQLLVGMATFDIVTAVAWSFATLPIDTDKAGFVEGAKGNAASCSTQAFFIQLGFTSVFFNVSLAIYYVLVVAQGWKEFQLQKIKIYLLAAPTLVGVALAFGGIPIYHFLEYGCHIETPPEGEMWAVLVFVVLPLGLSILAITAAMMMVYCKVRQQSATAKKWTMGVSKASKLEQAVFWQCLFYVMAFYITWPILFSVYLASLDDKLRIFGVSMLVAFVAPLQGFNNFLVYIRPKLARRAPADMAVARNCTKNCVASVLARILAVSPMEGGDNGDGSFNGLDPSAAVAMMNNNTQSTVPASSRFSYPGNEDHKMPDGEQYEELRRYEENIPTNEATSAAENHAQDIGNEANVEPAMEDVERPESKVLEPADAADTLSAEPSKGIDINEPASTAQNYSSGKPGNEGGAEHDKDLEGKEGAEAQGMAKEDSDVGGQSGAVDGLPAEQSKGAETDATTEVVPQEIPVVDRGVPKDEHAWDDVEEKKTEPAK